MRRELGQLSLADGLVAGGAGRNRQLERIAALVEWAAFERLLGDVYAAPVGRPCYGPGLVRRAMLTPGHISDQVPFVDLVRGDEATVYADRGYDGWWYRQELARRGIADGIMAGDDRQRPLEAAGRARNRTIGVIRAPVERTCAILKRWYGYGRVRYRSLGRNALQLQLLALALNLRRVLVLTG